MRSTAVIGLQMELEVARQRIEELEAENKKLSLDYISAVGQLQEALEKMEELERD